MRGWWVAVVLLAGCRQGIDEHLVLPDTLPDAYWCSIVAQECGPGAKCTLVSLDPGCATAGPVPVDAACVSPYADNCAVGGYCTAVGGIRLDDGGTPFCRALCSAELPCPTGKACVGYSNDGLTGMCIPACAAFSPCAGGLTCADYRAGIRGSPGNLVCRMPGGSAINSGCGSNFDCVADAICYSGACRVLCDQAHPCALGACLDVGGVDACL